MPIYEYECTACKHRFDRYQSFSEAAVTACPECGSPVRKVLQPVGIVFKGSGWYKNDSRSTSTNGKVDTGKDSASGSSTDGKASGETKSDTAGKSDGAAKPDGGTSDSGKGEPSAKADSGKKAVPASTGRGADA